MERHIFYTVEDFNDFCCQHNADTRAHWYYGPIETRNNGDVWTLREVKADLMAMDEADLVGDDRYIEVWDVDDGEVEALVVFKAGIIYSLERVNREKERVIAEACESNGLKRATESDFVDKTLNFNPSAETIYFAFVSEATLKWLEARYGLTPEPVPEEDYPF